MAAPTDAAGASAVLAPASAAERDDPALPTVRVWDVFVRVFHWSLVTLFVAAFVTGDEAEGLHIALGHAIAILVALRIVWGFVGTRYARFSDFVRSPMRPRTDDAADPLLQQEEVPSQLVVTPALLQCAGFAMDESSVETPGKVTRMAGAGANSARGSKDQCGRITRRAFPRREPRGGRPRHSR